MSVAMVTHIGERTAAVFARVQQTAGAASGTGALLVWTLYASLPSLTPTLHSTVRVKQQAGVAIWGSYGDA